MKITKEKVVHSPSPGVPSCFWVTMLTLPVLEITSIVYLARNPLWSGLQWSPDKQNQSFPWRQCSICSEILHTFHQSSSKKKFSFQSIREKSSFGKIIKGTLFSSFGAWAHEGHGGRDLPVSEGDLAESDEDHLRRRWISTEVLMKWGPVNLNQHRGETNGTESQKMKTRNDLYRL